MPEDRAAQITAHKALKRAEEEQLTYLSLPSSSTAKKRSKQFFAKKWEHRRPLIYFQGGGNEDKNQTRGGGGGAGRGVPLPHEFEAQKALCVQMYLCAKSHENRCTIQRQQNVN